MRLLLPLAVVSALLLAACSSGGNDDSEPAPTGASASPTAASPTAASPTAASPTTASPTAAATVEDRDEVETLLEDASLQLEDLPSGFALEDERFTTNEEASQEAGGPNQPTLEDFNSWGRVLGYDATYASPEDLGSILEGGTLSLTVTTTLYEDSDGAGRAFDYVRDQADDPEFLESFEETFTTPGIEVRDTSIDPLSLPDVGDDRQAYEIKVMMHSSDLDQDFDFVAQVFGIRTDRLVGAVTVITVNTSPPGGQLDDLARKLDDRMRDALE